MAVGEEILDPHSGTAPASPFRPSDSVSEVEYSVRPHVRGAHPRPPSGSGFAIPSGIVRQPRLSRAPDPSSSPTHPSLTTGARSDAASARKARSRIRWPFTVRTTNRSAATAKATTCAASTGRPRRGWGAPWSARRIKPARRRAVILLDARERPLGHGASEKPSGSSPMALSWPTPQTRVSVHLLTPTSPTTPEFATTSVDAYWRPRLGSAPVPMTVSAQCSMPHTGSPGPGGLLVALTTGLDVGATSSPVVPSCQQLDRHRNGACTPTRRKTVRPARRADDRHLWARRVAHRGSVRFEPPARVWSRVDRASWWGAAMTRLRVVPAALSRRVPPSVLPLPSSLSSNRIRGCGSPSCSSRRRRVAGVGITSGQSLGRDRRRRASSSGWLPSCPAARSAPIAALPTVDTVTTVTAAVLPSCAR